MNIVNSLNFLKVNSILWSLIEHQINNILRDIYNDIFPNIFFCFSYIYVFNKLLLNSFGILATVLLIRDVKMDIVGLCLFSLCEACLEKVQPLLIQWEWYVQHWYNLAAKESGLEWAWENNDDFTVLVSGGGGCPLSEHMYCMSITFKMTEQVEQQICIKFCIKLEHSSIQTVRMIEKATAMGSWWLAASSQQHTCSCIRSHAEFFDETSNHPGSSAHL